MKKSILNIGKALDKSEQKEVQGGGPTPVTRCNGTGTGGVVSEGCSQACVGQPAGTQCTINGYLAVCTGGCGFWFY
jgi:hypothetical protein